MSLFNGKSKMKISEQMLDKLLDRINKQVPNKTYELEIVNLQDKIDALSSSLSRVTNQLQEVLHRNMELSKENKELKESLEIAEEEKNF